MSKLALGTVQFGLEYGVANESGQINFSEAKNILKLAKEKNIDLIDTAIAYGNSEKVIGKIGIEGFKYISKLPALPENCKDIDYWIKDMVEASLKRLRIENLYGLLLHQPKDLLGASGEKLVNSLYKIKSSGLVKKIGISIYDPSEIEQVIDLLKIEIVQAPLNIIDRRLETSGWLFRLHQQKIEVHTRSTFLQGLLLMSKNEIPSKFSQWNFFFDRWFLELKKKNLSPVQACLSYPMSLTQVDRVVIGVDNLFQFKNLIEASKIKSLNHDLSFMISNDELLINPRNWGFL